jgi:alanine racemase
LLQLKGLRFEGLFSHLATADVPGHSMTSVQISRFRELVEHLEKKNLRPPICHLANSAGALNNPEITFDMVRPGIALYGYNPMGTIPGDWMLTPVMRMMATIRQIREVPTGESISYGQLWTATRPTRVATVAIGYGDGYMRGEVNQGWMFVHGKPCPILGRVCMDATMIDISEIPDAAIGDPVAAIHGELDSRISLESIADRCHTISYEIATRVARRLYRKYHWQGRLLRWDELRKELEIPAETSSKESRAT